MVAGVGVSVGLGFVNTSITETTNAEFIENISDDRLPPVLGRISTGGVVAVENVPAPLLEIQASAEVEGYQQADRLNPPPAIEAKTDTVSLAEFVIRLELNSSYNARQCIIDRESRSAGMYTSEYGGSPSGADGSTASGAYQWLNSSWQTYLQWTESYYGISLTSPEETARDARIHAAYANPFAQDLVSTFALLHRNLAQNQKPWPYDQCWAIVGSDKVLRADGPEFEPTPHIKAQLG